MHCCICYHCVTDKQWHPTKCKLTYADGLYVYQAPYAVHLSLLRPAQPFCTHLALIHAAGDLRPPLTVHALPFPDIPFCSAFLDNLHTPDTLDLGANLLQVR